MKKIKSIIASSLLMAGMITFSSCSNDEDTMIQGDNMLKITTNIADTRAVVTGTEFVKGDEIGVFVTNLNDYKYTDNSLNIKTVNNGNNTWTMFSNVALRNGEGATVKAYYPYNPATVVNGDSISIDITPNAQTGQPDIMYACADANLSNPSAYLSFKHTLARVTLAITKSSTDVGEGKITNVKVENGFYHEGARGNYFSTLGTLNLKTGSIRRIVDSNATISFATDCTIKQDVPQKIDLLFFPISWGPLIPMPMGQAGNARVTLEIDGYPYMFSFGRATWVAGKQYTYPITVNRQTDPSKAKVGDYYYSDGTWSTSYNENKECIGIVFALSEKAYGDIDVSLKASEHGRIVALKNLQEGVWSWYNIWGEQKIYDQSLCFDGFTGNDVGDDYYLLPIDGKNKFYNSDIQATYNYEKWIEMPAGEDYKHYSLCDYKGDEWTHNHGVTGISGISEVYQYKAGNKTWFVPSIGEMARLAMAYGYYNNFSDKVGFENFSDSSYWTSCAKWSNEVGTGAWYYTFFTGRFMADVITSSKHYIRPIASF